MTGCKSVSTPSAWPHRLAVALCCATFPLIWVGGLVTSFDAGMAVPDWPTTYGYNMFLYPWQTWVFGPFDLLVEHSHRLLGAVVGLLAIGFVVAVYGTDQRPWLRRCAMLALGLVIVQGVLGGYRVRLDERWLAMIHGCLGLGTFGFLSTMALVTSKEWSAARPAGTPELPTSLARLCWVTSAVVYLQVVLGALLRHMPVGASHQLFRVAVMFHLLLAAAVVIHAVLVMASIVRQRPAAGTLLRPAATLLALVALQVAVGAGTWVVKYGWPAWFADVPLTAGYTAGYTIVSGSWLQGAVATAHVAMGAVIFATSLALAVRATRACRSASLAMGSGALLWEWNS